MKYRNNIAISTIVNEIGEEQIALFIDTLIPIEMIAEIRKSVIRKLGIEISKCVKVSDFPMTTLGKISRYQLSLNYKNGEYHLYEKNSSQIDSFTINSKEDIERIIKEIIKDMLNKQVNSNDLFLEICQNSMTTTIILKEIVNEIESLGYSIDHNFCVSNISNTPTISDISIYLFKMIERDGNND